MVEGIKRWGMQKMSILEVEVGSSTVTLNLPDGKSGLYDSTGRPTILIGQKLLQPLSFLSPQSHFL